MTQHCLNFEFLFCFSSESSVTVTDVERPLSTDGKPPQSSENSDSLTTATSTRSDRLHKDIPEEEPCGPVSRVGGSELSGGAG